jgi:hypothetical protein
MSDDTNDEKPRDLLEEMDIFSKLEQSPERFVVLEALLWIEHLISEILNRVSEKDWSDKIYGRRFGYFDKVRIAGAIGLISDDIVVALQCLGEIRNQVAHKYDYVISNKEQDDFVSRVPKAAVDKCLHGGGYASVLDYQSKKMLEASAKSGLNPNKRSRVVYVYEDKGPPALRKLFALGWYGIALHLKTILHDLDQQRSSADE